MTLQISLHCFIFCLPFQNIHKQITPLVNNICANAPWPMQMTSNVKKNLSTYCVRKTFAYTKHTTRRSRYLVDIYNSSVTGFKCGRYYPDRRLNGSHFKNEGRR